MSRARSSLERFDVFDPADKPAITAAPSLHSSPLSNAGIAVLSRLRFREPDATHDFFTICTWGAIVALTVVGAVLMFASNLALQSSAFDAALRYIAVFGGLAVILRYRGWIRVAAGAGSAAQLLALMLLVPLTSVALATTNLPLRDGLLESVDHILFKVSAASIAQAQLDHATWMIVMNQSYASLLLQPLALIVVGSIFNPNQLAKFMFAWTISLCVCLAIFPFVPALGFYLHNGIDFHAAHSVFVPAAWRHAAILLPARGGELSLLGWEHINGIITFPSFHVAAAVLLGWGFLGTPAIIRWPALILNGLMLMSTVVIGGHYLIDVFAGIAVAIAVIGATNRLAIRRGSEPLWGRARATQFASRMWAP